MDRYEFCHILTSARKASKTKMKQLCVALDIMPSGINIIEKGGVNFNLERVLTYLDTIKHFIILEPKNKEFLIKGYDDLFIISNYNDAVKFIKTTREGKYSQRAIAEMIGNSCNNIVDIETKKHIMGIDTFLKIVDVLGYELRVEKQVDMAIL